MPVDKELLDILICPSCGGDVEYHQDEDVIVCLKCGAEFAYDWERMRAVLPLPTYGSLRRTSDLAWTECLTKRGRAGRFVDLEEC